MKCSFPSWREFWCLIAGAGIAFILFVMMMVFFAVTVHADQYQDLLNEYKQVYAEQLRVKVQHLPKKSFVEVSLKDGTSVRGTFEGFQKYNDSIWILPQGKHGIFSDKAYVIRQLQNIRVVEPL